MRRPGNAQGPAEGAGRARQGRAACYREAWRPHSTATTRLRPCLPTACPCSPPPLPACCHAGAAIPTDSPRFWSEAFTLRPAGGAAAAAAAAAAPGGGPPPAAAPCFLAPLAESILSAGKSTLLLQAYSAWRLAAAAASAEQRSAGGGASGGRGAWGTEGPPSPAKRRLSEFGALGFSAADSQQGQQGQPYGVPQPPATAAAASLAWLREASPGAGGGEGPGPEPLALHQQLLLNLEAQLHEQLSLTAGVQVEGAQPPGEEALQLHEDGSAEAGAGAGGSAGGDDGSSSASSEHELQHEWLAGAATCDAHTLQLPPLDMLPPLPVVPACAEALPAARTATISPADVAAAAGCEATPASSASAEPSIAERMRQAAAVRAGQAMCAAAEQLPDLLIPPAPFKALSGAARGDHAADGAAGGAAQRADEAAAQFESGAWQEWYRQTAAALSQQLHVLDCLGGGGASGNQRQLLSSYGVPLGLTPYSGSACDQLWGYRPGGGARQLPSAALGPAAAAEAPPLDVLLQHSLLRPVQAQVEAAGGELCTALLRHGLLRQVRTHPTAGARLHGAPCVWPLLARGCLAVCCASSMTHQRSLKCANPPLLACSWACFGTLTCCPRKRCSPLSASCCTASGEEGPTGGGHGWPGLQVQLRQYLQIMHHASRPHHGWPVCRCHTPPATLILLAAPLPCAATLEAWIASANSRRMQRCKTRSRQAAAARRCAVRCTSCQPRRPRRRRRGRCRRGCTRWRGCGFGWSLAGRWRWL